MPVKQREPSQLIAARLPQSLLESLDKEATRQGLTRSEMLRRLAQEGLSAGARKKEPATA